MSYGRRRGLRPVSPYAIVLALAVALTASFFLPLRAEAADLRPHGSDDLALGDDDQPV